MGSPLVVNAAELLRRAGNQKTVALTVPVGSLDVHDDDRFASDADVGIAFELESLSDGIVVDGTVTVPWHGTCRRCLEPTGGVSVSEVHELYQRVITDPEAFEIVGDQIDLLPVAREAVLLDAPTTPLCDPECKGLCPTCGANLNESTCSCTPPPADPRWSALDQLREG